MLRAAALAVSLALPAVAAPTREITLQRVDGKSVHPQAQAIASVWTGRSLGVTVRDGRQADDPAIVGAQQEKGKLLYEWKSTRPVPDSVRAVVEQTLESWGIGVSPEAPIKLELVLEGLRIDEVPETFGSTYRAEVSLKGGVFDPGGQGSAPSRVFTGSGKTSGPDRRAKLCNEAMSVALLMQLGVGGPSVHLPESPTGVVSRIDPVGIRDPTRKAVGETMSRGIV